MQLGQPLAQFAGVLLGQHLGGGHQGPLATGLDRREQRRDRHNGFAAAHIALHQPGHRPLPGQVGTDLGQHPPLGVGQGKGQQVQEGGHQAFPAPRQHQGRGGTAEQALTPLQQAQLQQQELIEHQPLPAGPELGLIGRSMNAVEGCRPIDEVQALPQGRRQGIAPGPGGGQHGLDRLPQPLGG